MLHAIGDILQHAPMISSTIGNRFIGLKDDLSLFAWLHSVTLSRGYNMNICHNNTLTLSHALTDQAIGISQYQLSEYLISFICSYHNLDIGHEKS